MTEAATLARPYAKAAFEIARDARQLKPWSEALARLAEVSRHPDMQAVLGSPRLSKSALADLVIEVAGGEISEPMGNLVRVLAENRRLPYLPEVARQFEVLAARETGIFEAVLVSAREPAQAQLEALRQGLQRRTRSLVRLSVQIDPALVGGAYLRSGDQVIDGSVRGRLERLAAVLNH